MRKLLNTLYISSEQLFLSLDNSNVVVKNPDGSENCRVPLHLLESIVTFSRRGISVPLIARCSADGIPIYMMSANGSLLAGISMPSRGNVLLRKAQYRMSDHEDASFQLASAFVKGKITNMKHLIDRYSWSHKSHAALADLNLCSSRLKEKLDRISRSSGDLEALRGLEGDATAEYFRCFGLMIQDPKGPFAFHGRSRRPPRDRTNAMLSFAYTLLTNECAAALESVGLDSYVGFLHQDHVGRKSLACDLVEELRTTYADRFVINLINNRIVQANHFEEKPDGAVYLNQQGRKIFLFHWQNYKKETLLHPELNENVPFGLLPYAQAKFLAKYIRGDSTEYVPFFRR